MSYYTCPVCTGAGTVSRPPYIAGDQPSWAANSTAIFDCKACDGKGILWHIDVAYEK